MKHSRIAGNGVRLHIVQTGSGRPLLLLHGWPEFWKTWQPVMQRLSGEFALTAPDFRGFGESDKPDGDLPSDQASAAVMGEDIVALLDNLNLAKVGLVVHDVGAFVAQYLAHRIPNRIVGMFYFDCPHLGMAARPIEPARVKETWYQSFQQLPWTAKLIASSRENCAAYIGHFLRHWSRNPAWVDDALESWVDNFMLPGNMQGGFNWYVSQNATRLAMTSIQPAPPGKIALPTCVRWGDSVVLPAALGDRLADTFADLDFAEFPGAGHFPHREDPDRAAAEIAYFFSRIWPK